MLWLLKKGTDITPCSVAASTISHIDLKVMVFFHGYYPVLGKNHPLIFRAKKNRLNSEENRFNFPFTVSLSCVNYFSVQFTTKKAKTHIACLAAAQHHTIVQSLPSLPVRWGRETGKQK